MSNTELKFSVVLTVYYGTSLLDFERCISSLMAQTYLPDEIVIVYDGDVGCELLTAIMGMIVNIKSPKLKCVSTLYNSGPGTARNLGFEIARNEWVAIMDSDDACVPDRFEIQCKLVNDDIDIIGGLIEEKLITNNLENTVIRSVPEFDCNIRREIKWKSPINNVTAFVRKSAFLSSGGYPALRFGEDYILWCRMLNNGSKAYNVQKILVRVTIDDTFFARRRGLIVMKREVEYISLMLREKHISLYNSQLKLWRAFFLRLMPEWLLKRVYLFSRGDNA